VKLDEPRAPKPGAADEAASQPRVGCFAAVAALAVVVGGAFAYRTWGPSSDEVAAPSAAPSAVAAPVVRRCVEVAPSQSYVVGPAPAERPADRDDLERDDLLAPFAVILGRAVAIEGGYALGVLGDGEGGSLATVVTVDADARTGKTVRLSRSRGDLDPPVVVPVPGAGTDVLVAFLEPDASGRAVRVARVHGDQVTFGADLHEGKDESLAVDLAAGKARGLVTWDATDRDESFVAIATFPVDAIGKPSEPRRISKKGIDAHGPRVVARDGGYFLVFEVDGKTSRRVDDADPSAAAPTAPDSSAAPSAAPEPSASPGKKKKPKASEDEDPVDESRGEPVTKSWLEVVALDESGAPIGDAIPVTPAEGHVVSFDVLAAPDGAVLVAWRDDDSPTGSGGGPVRIVRVTPGGPGTPYVGPDDAPADGAPTLLPGWLGMPTLQGPDLLARAGKDGLPAETLEVEPSLGRGEPIAATGDHLLLAEPEGKAMRLRVVTCGDRAAPVASASASASASADPDEP
jgi:hypothetical protein